MLYDCVDTNCAAGGESCKNRGSPGVEQYLTEDKGWGLKSSGLFEHHDIVVEYKAILLRRTSVMVGPRKIIRQALVIILTVF